MHVDKEDELKKVMRELEAEAEEFDDEQLAKGKRQRKAPQRLDDEDDSSQPPSKPPNDVCTILYLIRCNCLLYFPKIVLKRFYSSTDTCCRFTDYRYGCKE